MNSEILKRLISSIILIPLSFFCIINGSYYFYTLLILIFFISSLEWHRMTQKKAYNIYGFLYLILSIYCVFKLRVNLGNGYNFFLIITLICILTDIGGFLFGKVFKGPKLTKYSPNKTFSGSIGSFILPLLLLPITIFFEFIESYEIINFLILIIIISFSSQLGDIIISYFKRLSNIKDTGKIIPGHGGLLDRIDGMLFAFPLSYLLIQINYFKIL